MYQEEKIMPRQTATYTTLADLAVGQSGWIGKTRLHLFNGQPVVLARAEVYALPYGSPIEIRRTTEGLEVILPRHYQIPVAITDADPSVPVALFERRLVGGFRPIDPGTVTPRMTSGQRPLATRDRSSRPGHGL